ncbi:hypothetical protein ACQCN2_19365 [Brevibacillus ginsengisoli]|uniref:hypothetical protein n=1 Tax=Brevibacillus ginsengisoli TaxID=363854 RepID=UPI003CE9D045
MSEYTYATLVKSKSQDNILSCLKEMKTEGYFLEANEDWFAVVINNDVTKGNEVARFFSDKLDTFSFFFWNCEDHGWGYSLFYRGEKVGSLRIDYEQINESDVSEANVGALKEIVKREKEFNLLKDWMLKVPTDILEGIQYYKNAFAFEKIEWVSYDYFSSLGDDALEQMGIMNANVEGNPKLQVSKIILDVLEWPLGKLGYTWRKDKKYGVYRGEYVFLKTIDRFEYGLVISTSQKNLVEANIFSPVMRGVDMFRVIERDNPPTFHYKTERELRLVLGQILQYFLLKGDKWLSNHVVKA